MSGKRGVFIAIEGLDCSGKSTQVQLLRDHLEEKKEPVKLYKFPTRDGPIGRLIDQYLKRELSLEEHGAHLLFSADRWAKAREIRDLLASGTHVIADRYVYSGRSYSMAKGLSYEWCAEADVGLPQPDVVAYLDIPVELIPERRDFGRERYEVVEFQKKVRNAFLKTVRSNNFAIIDSSGSVISIHKQICWYFYEAYYDEDGRGESIGSV